MKPVYAWSRLFARTAAAALGREGRPTKLNFVVTKRCHSRCVYCDIWKIKDTPGALDAELTLDEIRALAVANPYFQWIDFTGGEPTDRPDFVSVVQAFAAASPHLLLVHFPTNGIATKRIVEIVSELRRTVRARLVVTVSIDGPPELNDRLRGIRHDFAHAVDTYAALRPLLGPENVFVGMTLHGHSGSTGRTTTTLVEETHSAINAALADRQSAPFAWTDLHLNIPHLSQHYYGNQAASERDDFGGPAHRAEVADALRAAASRAESHGSLVMRTLERIYRAEAAHYLAHGDTRIGCAALLSTLYLSEKGEVYPCTIWDRPLGNVRNHGFDLLPILQAARQSGVRQAIAEHKCPRCWTPCEAYPAIGASPLRSVRTLLAS